LVLIDMCASDGAAFELSPGAASAAAFGRCARAVALIDERQNGSLDEE
jgi:hypothetical protein